MGTPHSSKTIAATFTRKNADGETETAHGQFIMSESVPNHVVHLFSDFASEAPHIERFFSSESEVNTYPILHAQTEEGSFTFVDLRLAGYKRNFGGGKLTRRTYQPYVVIKSEVLLEEDDLFLTHAAFRFWGQDAWAQWVNWNIETNLDDEQELQVTRLNIPTRTVVYRGVEVSLKDASPRVWSPGNSGKLTLTQTSMFKLTFPEPIRLRDFISGWVLPLSFLVGSGIRSAAGIESMWIGNTTWTYTGSGELVGRDVQVLANNPDRKVTPDDLEEGRFMHRLRNFDYEMQLPIFFDAWKKHQVTFEQYVDWIQQRPTSRLTQMSYLAQLVETFDRSINPDPETDDALRELAASAEAALAEHNDLNPFAKKAKQAVLESARPTLRQRLARMDSETGELLTTAIGGVRSWKDDVSLVRNSLIHGLPTSVFLARNHIPLYVSIDILEILFEARLLVTLGFTPEQVEQILTKDNPRWYQRVSQITDFLDSLVEFRNFVPPADMQAEDNDDATPDPAT